MRRVVFCYFAMHGTQLQRVVPPPPLDDESPLLCERFRKTLLEQPQGFHFDVELEGFPVVHFEWVPLGHTSGALLLPPFPSNADHGRPRPPHELVAILLNGLESPEDLRKIVQRFPLRPDVWQEVMLTEKPVAVGALYTVGRIREPATTTITHAFANAFFSLFGTNEVTGAG
jgi:hypothetical protein